MRQHARHRRPTFDQFESRALPSAIIDLMASHTAGHRPPSSSSSIAIPANQGVQGTNLVLNPVGEATPRELKKEAYIATFTGTFTQGPGAFSTEASRTSIRAAGGSNQMLHGDIQILLATPNDPSLPLSGTASIFDRNLNSNSVFGLDFSAPSQNTDRAGRPTQLTGSLDVNTSAGSYAEGYFQGTMTIHYIPSAKQTPGVLSQGKAIVRIQGQVYTSGTNFILTNSNIDP